MSKYPKALNEDKNAVFHWDIIALTKTGYNLDDFL